jgi:hypothetical protein
MKSRFSSFTDTEVTSNGITPPSSPSRKSSSSEVVKQEPPKKRRTRPDGRLYSHKGITFLFFPKERTYQISVYDVGTSSTIPVCEVLKEDAVKVAKLAAKTIILENEIRALEEKAKDHHKADSKPSVKGYGGKQINF